MVLKVRCDGCQKEFTLLGNQNKFGEIYLCNNCKLAVPSLFRLSNINTAKNPDLIIEKVEKELKRSNFPENTIQKINDYINNRTVTMEENKQEKIKEKEFKAEFDAGIYDEQIKNFLITSGYNFEGYQIVEYLDFICEEYVMGTGWLSSKESGIMDFLGGESTMYGRKLKQSKNAVKLRAMKEAMKKGGNAIIGASMAYTTFSRDMIGVIFTGTSVKIEKIGFENGQSVDNENVCNKCGTENKKDARFCINCGNILK